VPLGTVAQHTARVQFATNLFQAGGIEVVNIGPDGDYACEFVDAGSGVACICGTDAAYAEEAAEWAETMHKIGAKAVFLAGKPNAAYREVDQYIFAGCDALETLTSLHALLGVTR
jgi:methylmalonyl-CoA mutase